MNDYWQWLSSMNLEVLENVIDSPTYYFGRKRWYVPDAEGRWVGEGDSAEDAIANARAAMAARN